MYRVVLELAPRHGDASRLLGAIYLQAGKPEQALPLLQDALQEQPQNPEILNCLGIALGEAGRGEEAVTHFRQAVAINPVYVEALNNLGNAPCRGKASPKPRLIASRKCSAESRIMSVR